MTAEPLVIFTPSGRRGRFEAGTTVLDAARRLGVEPGSCAAIEDSENGIRSALAAGMRVVAIPNRVFAPSDEALSRADASLGSLDELTPEVIESF